MKKTFSVVLAIVMLLVTSPITFNTNAATITTGSGPYISAQPIEYSGYNFGVVADWDQGLPELIYLYSGSECVAVGGITEQFSVPYYVTSIVLYSEFGHFVVFDLYCGKYGVISFEGNIDSVFEIPLSFYGIDESDSVEPEEPSKDTLEYYADNLDSNVYDADLVSIMARLSNAAYNKQELKSEYNKLGFTAVDVYDYAGLFNPNACGYAIGLKFPENKDEMICLITVRGSDNTSDWLGNFNITTSSFDGLHIGFANPATRILNSIKTIVGDVSGQKNIKYFITGHSRGAAVANLLSVMLMNDGVSAQNVYNYNFACPDVACRYVFLPTYTNIFNLCNRTDIVAHIPGDFCSVFTEQGKSWGKFGQTYWFTDNRWDSSKSLMDNLVANHSMGLYEAFFATKPAYPFNSGSGDQVFDAVTTHMGWIAKIMCPVDVILTDEEGNKVAAIINGEIEYYDENCDNIILFTDGEHKVIYVKDNNFNYNIELIGTDNGEMTYSVEKYNFYTDEASESKTFTDVQLFDGKKMISYISQAESTEDVELFVVQEINGVDSVTHSIGSGGTEEEIAHIYVEEIIDATCTEDGYRSFKCVLCEYTYSEDVQSAKGHIESEWITDKTATCTVVGSRYIECTVCYAKLAVEEIPVTEHTDENSDSFCDSCGEIIKQQGDIDCNHICHSDNGFLQFIWKIYNFLMKLFSMEKYCSCGVAHY